LIPIETSFEGRVYARLLIDVPWNSARSIARALTYKGVNGTLVSIRSAAEQTFVSSLIVSFKIVSLFAALVLSANLWIGGTDSVAEGEFRWIDDNNTIISAGYTNYNTGEPNNAGDEDCLEIAPTGKWNDGNCTVPKGFIVEFRCLDGFVFGQSSCIGLRILFWQLDHFAACRAGCERGSCQMPGECNCNLGWSGDLCNVGGSSLHHSRCSSSSRLSSGMCERDLHQPAWRVQLQYWLEWEPL
jgi:hypothetical protein